MDRNLTLEISEVEALQFGRADLQASQCDAHVEFAHAENDKIDLLSYKVEIELFERSAIGDVQLSDRVRQIIALIDSITVFEDEFL